MTNGKMATRKKANNIPDIRVHSAGAANAYGSRPMTAAGKAFVDATRRWSKENGKKACSGSMTASCRTTH